MSSVPFMPGEPKLTSPHKETDPFHEPLITYPGTSDAGSNLTPRAAAASQPVGGGDEHRFDLL
jgi:hypothetical protein